jgi:hypothetical protein
MYQAGCLSLIPKQTVAIDGARHSAGGVLYFHWPQWRTTRKLESTNFNGTESSTWLVKALVTGTQQHQILSPQPNSRSSDSKSPHWGTGCPTLGNVAIS